MTKPLDKYKMKDVQKGILLRQYKTDSGYDLKIFTPNDKVEHVGVLKWKGKQGMEYTIIPAKHTGENILHIKEKNYPTVIRNFLKANQIKQ